MGTEVKNKRFYPLFASGFVTALAAIACCTSLNGDCSPPPARESPPSNDTNGQTTAPGQPPSGPPLDYATSTELIYPQELVYLGAFRLPDGSGGSSWEYSGHGLTHYPAGDPAGSEDGFSGSLFGIGHDHQLYVSEINIPIPVNSRNLDELNVATTLQPFQDITGSIFSAEDMALPRAGLEYLPPQSSQITGKLNFVWGQHFQYFEPSHGWSELELSNPQPSGPWLFDGYTNYVTSDYLFEIPESWADTYFYGHRLATGRFREGVWGGRGPALFAFSPWNDGNPPSPNSTLSSITPLLLYGIQEPDNPDIISDISTQMNGYQEADHWSGGAWLTVGDKSAVIFAGTKAMGSSWYGYANGLIWPYDCAEQNPPTCPDLPDWPFEDRGYWAEDYQAQVIFFDPNDLAAVAQGQMETHEPQPYATLDLTPYLYAPQLDYAEYKRDLVGAVAFDREHGLLYVVERLADEYKSVIHVFQITASEP